MLDAPVGDARPPERIAVRDLVLRRWRPEDLDGLHRAVMESIDHLRPWMAWANEDPFAHRDFLQASASAWERGESYEYAILDGRADIIGSVGLLGRIGPGGLEIGYWVHTRHTGRGVATLATAALTDAAVSLPAVDRVQIHHDEANIASGAVPARLGFEMVERVAREPMAPADSGWDLIWRLSRDSFRGSECQLLLERTGVAPNG